jgi:hypothetical protein
MINRPYQRQRVVAFKKAGPKWPPFAVFNAA